MMDKAELQVAELQALIFRARGLALPGSSRWWDGDYPVDEIVREPYILRHLSTGSVIVVVKLAERLPWENGADCEAAIWQDGKWLEDGPWQQHLPAVIEVLRQEIEAAEAAIREAERRRREALYTRAREVVNKFIRQQGGVHVAVHQHRGAARADKAAAAENP